MKPIIIVVLSLVLIGEIIWLEKNADLMPETKSFTDALERQASSTARQRLAWIHKEILKNGDVQDSETWLELAMFYDIYGYHRESTAAYHVCQQLDPTSFDAFYGYASVAVKIGVLDAAEDYFKQALVLATSPGQSRQCLYRLGLLALRSEQLKAARSYFDKAIAIEEHWPSIYERLFIAVCEGDEGFFERWYPKLAQAQYMTSEVFYLNLLACEQFPDMGIKRMHEMPVRTSELYQEFNYEGERLMRLNVGISTRDLFLSDRSVEEYAVLLHKQLADIDAINSGRTIFTQSNCITCHGKDARGQVGPNLTDDYWLHGSHLEKIIESISEGRHNMPAHKHSLSAEQVFEVALFILDNNLKTEKSADGSSQGKAAEGEPDPIPKP